MKKDDIVGAWRLVSFELRTRDGQTSFPLGSNPQGYLLYTHDGFMSAVVTADARAPLAAPDMLLAKPEEQARTAATCLAYSGPFELRGDRVHHSVQVSLFPNWVGAVQERIVSLAGDELEIATPEMPLGGVPRTAHLVWRRAGTRAR